MAVLLPKAAITHDCTYMEFKGHVSPVKLPSLVEKTRKTEEATLDCDITEKSIHASSCLIVFHINFPF